MHELDHELMKKFDNVRTGDLLLTSTGDFGDVFSFIFRLGNYCHSLICAWVNQDLYEAGEFKFVPHYVEGKSFLVIVGMARQRAWDMFTRSYKSGLVVYEPVFYFDGVKQVITRAINRELFSDEMVSLSLEKFLHEHSPTAKFAFAYSHVLAVALGMKFTDKQDGYLCSELIYTYLHETTGYPDTYPKGYIPKETDIVPDSPPYMYTPDMFSSKFNNHPIFDGPETIVMTILDDAERGALNPVIIIGVITALCIILVLFLVLHLTNENRPAYTRKFRKLEVKMGV
jgi:hypothetical protein